MSYNGPNHEAVVISSLALSHYHEFCGHYRSRSRSFFLPAHATTTVGMVVRHHPSSCEVESPVNIAFMPLLDVVVLNTSWSWASGADSSCGSDVWPGGLPGTLMSDSWRRYRFDQISAVTSITRYLYFNYLDLWLGQANHIFSSLHITSTHDQYAVVDRVRFTCIFTPTTRPSCPSQGWLFVCPDAQLRSGPCSFRWPDCAAYWSRDPFGAVRLSTEEAEEAGFPLIKLQLRVSGKYWDDTDYARLWQFHQAKGFVPNSQEIAQHLGHPLYQLCDELRVEAPFAHGKLNFWNLNVH
ncbi:hypothetical protein B0H11DRAFT_339887 [Mycena galericulata]|nr:hypothetical protein B0H11DRAFT_339887 [Mycena galericulata]